MEYTPETEPNRDMCALVQDLLPLYLDDEVSMDSRALIAAHLNECPHCAGFLAGARSVREQLRRERQRETSRLLGTNPIPALAHIGVKIIGAFGLAVCAVLSVIGLFPLLNGSRTSWLMPIMYGVSLHTLYGVFCLIVVGYLSLKLVNENAEETALTLMLSIVGILAAGFGLMIPIYNSSYALLGLTLFAVAIASLTQQRSRLHHLSPREFVKYGIGLSAATLGITILLSFASVRPNYGSGGYINAYPAPTSAPAFFSEGASNITPTAMPSGTDNVYPPPAAYPPPTSSPTPAFTPTPKPLQP